MAVTYELFLGNLKRFKVKVGHRFSQLEFIPPRQQSAQVQGDQIGQIFDQLGSCLKITAVNYSSK
jgi:hypothetical protein